VGLWSLSTLLLAFGCERAGWWVADRALRVGGWLEACGA
jgi:hypothetical protein